VGANPDGIRGRLAFAGNNGRLPSPVIVLRPGADPEKPWKCIRGFAPSLAVAYAGTRKTVVAQDTESLSAKHSSGGLGRRDVARRGLTKQPEQWADGEGAANGGRPGST